MEKVTGGEGALPLHSPVPLKYDRHQRGRRHARRARGTAFIACKALARVRAGRGCRRGTGEGDMAQSTAPTQRAPPG